MRRRHDPKPIQGWGWLGDAAEEAAVEAMAPAGRLKSAARVTMAAMKAKQKTPPGRARFPAEGDRIVQLSDDEYRQLAKQQYEAEGEIEIDPKASAPFQKRRYKGLNACFAICFFTLRRFHSAVDCNELLETGH